MIFCYIFHNFRLCCVHYYYVHYSKVETNFSNSDVVLIFWFWEFKFIENNLFPPGFQKRLIWISIIFGTLVPHMILRWGLNQIGRFRKSDRSSLRRVVITPRNFQIFTCTLILMKFDIIYLLKKINLKN